MAAMQLTIVPVTPFQQNCSVLWCERTRAAAIVDPGGELDTLLEVVRGKGLRLTKILVTHGHLDHAAGVAELARRCRLPIEGPHPDDAFWIAQLAGQARQFGFAEDSAPFTPTRWLHQGDEVTVGDIRLEVLHCPGHTPGHVVFFSRAHRIAIVGDVLFAGSIGRSDFPRGNHADLIRSIRERLFPLGDDVQFVPGHGPSSSFGAERRSNPFVSDAAVAAVRRS
jgi:glyoxylase-like metal-dependent hydrolase (beta-lactamase superfamily II)